MLIASTMKLEYPICLLGGPAGHAYLRWKYSKIKPSFITDKNVTKLISFSTVLVQCNFIEDSSHSTSSLEAAKEIWPTRDIYMVRTEVKSGLQECSQSELRFSLYLSSSKSSLFFILTNYKSCCMPRNYAQGQDCLFTNHGILMSVDTTWFDWINSHLDVSMVNLSI